jgi:hypothetical protein
MLRSPACWLQEGDGHLQEDNIFFNSILFFVCHTARRLTSWSERERKRDKAGQREREKERERFFTDILFQSDSLYM